MARFKTAIVILAISIVFNWLCCMLKSTAIDKLLQDKVLEILITLMAINTATISVVVAKLHDIEKELNISLKKTIREVRISLIEQFVLIILSIITIVLYNSEVIKLQFVHHERFFNTINTFIFVYGLDILRDTGMAIFSIVSYRNRNQ